METQTASVYSTGSVPRLRVTRHITSPNITLDAAVPRPADVHRSLSYPDSQTTSEDESGAFGYAGANPRLLSASLPPADSSAQSGDTAHRLRALLNRFDTPSRTPVSASRVVMPPSPSEPESDFDLPLAAQTARASIKDLFKNALREPGDTPQKPRPTRRASFNAVGSPKVSKSRRKSTSDEEREILAKRYNEGRSDLSAAASLDRLRLQLTESMPSIQDAPSTASTSHPPSEATVSTPKRATPSHRASKIPVSQSPMKHAKSHQDLEPFTTANAGAESDVFTPQRQRTHSSHIPRAHTPTTEHSLPHAPHINGSTSVTRQHSHDSLPHGSRASSSQSDADYRERLREFQHETNRERERDWNRRHLPPPPLVPARIRTTSSSSLHSTPAEKHNGRVNPGQWPTPPLPGTSPSNSRSPRQSLTTREDGSGDGYSEDGRSSRGTSASSNAEYRERVKEAERERQRELERSWNRPHPQHSQSVPHLHVEDAHSHVPRPGSSTGHSHSLAPTNSRPHSRIGAGHDHARPPSPSSSTSSRSHHSEEVEELHEREWNWNVPKPKWGEHPHHPHHGSEADHYHFPRTASPLPSSALALGKEHTSRQRMGSSTSLNVPADGQSHPRPHSRLENGHGHSRSDSPSSSTSSLSFHEEDVEELHERERNWNAPKPKWGEHPHHHAHPHPHEAEPRHSRGAPSPSPGHNASLDKEREQGWGRHRTSSSLSVHTNGHSPRPVSPAPNAHLQASASSSHRTARSKSPVPPPRTQGAHHPRPNSPLPPPGSEKGKPKEVDVDREKGWDSPKVSSHRYERTPSSPTPVSRPGSRASNHGPLGRTLSTSATAARQAAPSTPSPDQGTFSATDAKKGHRRTTTELSESTGAFPRQTSLPSALSVPDDDSDISLSMFAEESVPPPQMSTPTFKAVHLADLTISPAASDIPLPPSPPSPLSAKRDPSAPAKRDPSARADADLARLQRAVAPNFTFPARRPSPPSPPSPPPPSSLSTPPRRTSFNTQRLEFRTPSPPTGLPELPGPPSSDEEVKTPVKSNGEAKPSLSMMKTPRFPGAYGTPAPPPLEFVAESTLEADESADSEEGAPTPKLIPIDATPSPGLVPPTPAPPGAYRATPTPAKRKGILKVRFDGDVQTSEGLVESPVSATNGVAAKPKEITPPPSPSSEDIPPLSLSPSRRKGLRLVDEYGRERRFTEDGEEIMLSPRNKSSGGNESPKPIPVDDTTLTPRRRAKMRQVDALGNEVIEGEEPKMELKEEPREETNGKLLEARGKKALFSRLTRSLGELQNELAEEEDALAASAPESGTLDQSRVADLTTLSRTARIERNKLERRLQLERHAEGGLADKIFVARHPSRDFPLGTPERGPWWRRKWRLVIFLFILEVMLLYAGYRFALMHAKQSWLSTHFDPFYPALYLHQSRPSFLSRYGSLPMDWSAFAISGAVRRVGVRGFVVGVGKRLWDGMWSWGLEPWEAWGSPAAGPPVPRPWPS